MKGLIVDNKTVVLKNDLMMLKPKKGQVLVKVKSSSINQIDVEFYSGKYDLFLKLARNNSLVKTGVEFSGIVESNGVNFKKGDLIYGYVHLVNDAKTHQEYICVDEGYIAHMPSNVSFEEAASLPLGTLTVFNALTDVVSLKAGQHILLNGASGGLGVYAIQIAKMIGASVTAIAGSNQESFLKSLGADVVIDYNQVPLKELKTKFDVVFDLSNKECFNSVRMLLSPEGAYIPAEPNKHLVSYILNFFRSQKTKYLYVDKGDTPKLTQIAQWVEKGHIKPVIDSVYEFENYFAGFERLSQRGKKGRIILNISD